MPSTMHDTEQDDEGILERESKGKQNMLMGKDEELSKWEHLPSDILEMIMKRLKLVDYLAIRGVCSTWRATIIEVIANKHCHPLPELPLILLKTKKKSMFLPSKFFSISTEQACSLKSKSITLDRNHSCHGTVEGWMILSENLAVGTKVIYFLNPVTEDVVKVPSPLNLPSKSPIPDRSHLNMGHMVASSSPKCEDCAVVGLFTDYAHIAICKVNSDKSWTVIEAKNEDTGNFMEVEIFNGKLYVITDRLNGSMLVYDLQDFKDEPPKPIVLDMIPPIRPLPLSSTHGNQIHGMGVHCYLTGGYASEELLLIYSYANYVYEAINVGYLDVIKQYVSPPQMIKCEVFKLDADTNKWVNLDHLGDRVVFLGHDKSFVMSRTKLNSTEELIAENAIYFAHYARCSEKPWLNNQLGRLCLTDNSIKYFSLEQLGHELDIYPFWFVPSAW